MKKVNYKKIILKILLLFVFLFINLNIDNFAATKKTYKVSIDATTGIETLVDNKNKKILKTKNENETMLIMKENVTNVDKIVCIIKPNNGIKISTTSILDNGIIDENVVDDYTFTYYGFDGKKISIKDAGMKKINYIIGNYLIYVVWEGTEPIMKAYHLTAHKIVTLGKYNYLNIVNDTVILSKDVYGIYYDENKSEGLNSMVVCDVNLKKIQKIDGYSFDSVVYVYGRQFYLLCSKNDAYYNDKNRTNVMINLCDEEFKLLFSELIYENDEFTIENKGKYVQKKILYNFEDIKQKDSSEMVIESLTKRFKYNFLTESIVEEYKKY